MSNLDKSLQIELKKLSELDEKIDQSVKSITLNDSNNIIKKYEVLVKYYTESDKIKTKIISLLVDKLNKNA